MNQPFSLYTGLPVAKEPWLRVLGRNVTQWLVSGSFREYNLTKIYNARNHIYGKNFKLALSTRRTFQLEMLPRSMISAVHKFRENILESSLASNIRAGLFGLSVASSFKMASVRVRCIRGPIKRVLGNVATRISIRYTDMHNQDIAFRFRVKIWTKCTENDLIWIVRQGVTACLCGRNWQI